MAEGRGSDKLPGTTLSEEHLAHVVEIAKDEGIELLWHWWRGQPNPEILGGLLQIDPALASGVIARLIGNELLRFRLDVFPYGIPNVDRVLVGFEAGGGGIEAGQ